MASLSTDPEEATTMYTLPRMWRDRTAIPNVAPAIATTHRFSGSDDELMLSDDSLSESDTDCSGLSSATSSDFATSGVSATDVTSSASDTASNRRRRRKSSKPTRSASPEDPDFQGVTVQFRARIFQKRLQLIITAYFNCRKLSRRKWRHGLLLSTLLTDSSDVTEACTPRPAVRHSPPWNGFGKQCASCCTRKTPLWRDAEDGTPLCNACGIRYKKYRVRCGHCWFVPKKESKTNPVCTNCGEILRFSFFRLKPSVLCG